MQFHNPITFTTEDGRHKIKEIANSERTIYGITPFGLSEQIKAPQKQIVRKKKYQRKYSLTRVNSNVHAKLLLTNNFILHGSCNFTENSIQNQHEIIHLTPKQTAPKQYNNIKKYFETLWERSTEVEQK